MPHTCARRSRRQSPARGRGGGRWCWTHRPRSSARSPRRRRRRAQTWPSCGRRVGGPRRCRAPLSRQRWSRGRRTVAASQPSRPAPPRLPRETRRTLAGGGVSAHPRHRPLPRRRR
uniref:Uncharacterized protein n=1 Tax=Arundo donax TaxID=35708 RepID=A0A0A9EW55_ARUDO